MTDPLGQSQVLPYLCGLSKKGFEFDLISFEKPDKYSLHSALIERICKENNITWHPQKYTKKPPVLSTIYDLLKMKRLANELHQHKLFQGKCLLSFLSELSSLPFRLIQQL